jgi:hypothetical protein
LLGFVLPARSISAKREDQMIKFAALVALAAACGPVFAQFKCAGPDGKVAFQQQPCAAGQKGGQMEVKVSPPSASGTAAAQSGAGRIQQFADQLTRERRVRELEFQVRDKEAAIAGNQAQLDANLQRLKDRKNAANNNLAGAVWEQSLSSEMQALAERHKAANDADLEQLKALRAALAEARAAARPVSQ